MKDFSEKNDHINKRDIVKTFPVPITTEESKGNIFISNNKVNEISQNKIMEQAFICHSKGNILEAAKYYKYCLDEGCFNPRVYLNYGLILKGFGKLKKAELYLRKAIELKLDFPEAHHNLGLIMKDLGKLKEAELSIYKAIQINPNSAEAYHNLGLIMKDLGKIKEAEKSISKAIGLKSNYAIAYYNLGTIFLDQGKSEEAKVSLYKAIELRPDHADAHYNLGIVYYGQDEFDLAINSFNEAIKLRSNFTKAYNNLGTVFLAQDKTQDAIQNFEKAINLDPKYSEAYYNKGIGLTHEGSFSDAIDSFRKAIKLNPNYADPHLNLSHSLFFVGDYARGWEEYEYRFDEVQHRCIPHAKPPIKRWEGETLQPGEPLLVVSEQGLGDTIHFMRYIPHLMKIGVNVSFCAQPQLHDLIKSSGVSASPLAPEEANLISKGKWIPLLSLPRYLGVTAENPITTKPYLSAPKQLVDKWETILNSEKRPIIGLSWQGNPKIEDGYCKGRSMPLEGFSEIAKTDKFSFLSLQKGFGAEQLEQCSFKDQFVHCQDTINSTCDFLDTAAIIEHCDLVITTDTCVAHIAAGMGKPTWVLLKAFLTWRYGLGRETFWYPSMRLFHQKEIGNWKEVLERVAFDLKNYESIIFD